MPTIFLSLLLAMQLMFSGVSFDSSTQTAAVQTQPSVSRLWWGMLDPELSVWFARIPMDESHTGRPILWDWSWRNFFAGLFQQPMLKEAAANASSV